LTVKDEFAGRKGKCPKCQGALQIPAAGAAANEAALDGGGTATVTRSAAKTVPAPAKSTAAAPAPAAPAPAAPARVAAPMPTSPAEWQTTIEAAFRPGAEAELAKVSLGSGFGLLVQMGVMSLLALGYIVVLAVLGGALAWWGLTGGTYDTALWLGPLGVGGLIFLLLLKPLFAPAHARGKGREITAKEEPAFAGFVEKLCATIACQPPKRIEVDSNLETWAGMQGGKLVLRVGLPLVAMMPLDQLAGLMAGQLGEYPKGSGGSRRRFIRGIYRWYSRAVFGVDAWDEKLIVAARRSGIATRWIYQLARSAPKIAALLLWPLAVMSRAFGEGATQTLDKHAETCALTLVGSKTALATMQRMKVIRFLWSQVQGDIGLQIREKQVPDNLPQVLIDQLRNTPQEVLALATGFDHETADLTDPTEAERLAAARSFAGEGVFVCPLPASGLFREFAGIAKIVTADYYRNAFGKQFNPTMLKKS
jgi:hypothetical protein